MKGAINKLLKKYVDVTVAAVGELIPQQLLVDTQPVLPAVPAYRIPMPHNEAQLPLAYRARFDGEQSLPERNIYLLRNVQVSWHGVVFQNLQLFRPSVAPTVLEPEFNGSFLLRQWWRRASRNVLPAEVIGLAYGPWASGNYFHWMVDTLPRLLILQRYYPACRLLVPPTMPIYAAKTVAMFDFKSLLPLNDGEILTVPQLAMPDYTAYPAYQDPVLMREVQQVILRAVGVQAGKPSRRVYVSRARQRIRRLLNETAIEGLLQQYGFEIMFFEELSFEQQVELLHETAVLIGLHGAGLTNTLFMQPQTAVIELMSDSVFNPCYYHLINAMELNYYHVPCYSADQGVEATNNSDVEINPVVLEQILSTLFATE